MAAAEVDVCLECNKKITKKDYSVQCSEECGGWIHKKCSEIDNEQWKLIEKGKEKFSCKKCIASLKSEVKGDEILVSEDKKAIQEILKLVEKLTIKIKVLEDENAILKNRMTCIENGTVKECYNETRNEVVREYKKTFAETVKNQAKSEVLIVKQISIKNGTDSKKIVSELKEKVDPVNLNVGIKSIKNISNGGVAVHCESGKDVEILKSEVENKLGDQYQVLIPAGRRPQFKIVGIMDKLTEQELIKCLIAQNQIILDQEDGQDAIKVIKIVKGKIGQTAIIESSSTISQSVLLKERLKIKWSICPVYEYVSILRCYRCNGYYHKAADCKNEAACGLCGDNAHETNKCKTNEVRCVNCVAMNKKLSLHLDVGHSAFDPKCCVYKKKVEVMKNRINYDIKSDNDK
ncbi:hypothetical protein RI129_000886 [Pyrocoelia pectoralis]|uniref:Uncharacterized protein n=1 Tax=Pyrocoelia pectoralis TaxID=417401 RepID=A0AAN7VJS5_9COLE